MIKWPIQWPVERDGRFIYEDGGTESALPSGALRWSFRGLFENSGRTNCLVRIMESEPGFDFEPYAKLFRNTPENFHKPYGFDEGISPEGQNYLTQLEMLNQEYPAVAIKVAAISLLAAKSYREPYPLLASLMRNFFSWIRAEGADREKTIEAAMTVFIWWNKIACKEDILHEFPDVLLEIICEHSQKNPEFIMSQIQKIWKFPSSILFSFDADQDLTVELGRRVCHLEPNFTKAMLERTILSTRFERSRKTKIDIESMAAELYDLELRFPSKDCEHSFQIYSSIVIHGVYGREVWKKALAQLFAEAFRNSRVLSAGRQFATVALHTEEEELRARALLAFEIWANLFSNLTVVGANEVNKFTNILMGVLQDAGDEKTVTRNPAVSAQKDHPVAAASKAEFWKFVEALLEQRSPEALRALILAIKGGDEETSESAATCFCTAFDELAPSAVKEAGEMLVLLGQSSMLTFRPPREGRPARLREVYNRSWKSFSGMVPEEANTIQKSAFRHWSD